jgi:hypothetical protein
MGYKHSPHAHKHSTEENRETEREKEVHFNNEAAILTINYEIYNLSYFDV